MRGYIASRAVVDALDVASERVATVQYELNTVKDTEAALRVTRGLEGELGALRRKIDVVTPPAPEIDGKTWAQTNKLDTSARGNLFRRSMFGAVLLIAGAGIMKALEFGGALIHFMTLM